MTSGDLGPVLRTRSADAFFDAYDQFWGAGWDLEDIASKRLRMLFLCHHLAVHLASDIAAALTEDDDDHFVRALPDLLAWCDTIRAPLATDLLTGLRKLFPAHRIPRADVARWRAVERLQAQTPSPFQVLQRNAPRVRAQLAKTLRRYLRDNRSTVEADFRLAAPTGPETPSLAQLAAIQPATLFAEQLWEWLAAKAPFERQPPRGRAIWSLLALESSLATDGSMHFWESAQVSLHLDTVLAWVKELSAPKTKGYLKAMIHALPSPPPRHERSRVALMRRLEASTPSGDPFMALDRRYAKAVVGELPKALQAYARRYAASLEADYGTPVG